MSCSGTPVSTDAGVYLITIKADDGDPETANATSSFSLTVVANQAPTTTQTISNISSLVYYPIDISWNSSLFTDINGDTPNFTIITNATGSWYTISNSYPKLYGTPSSNSYSGNFTVFLDAHDNYGGHTYYTVGLEIKRNDPPVVNKTWPNALQAICLIPWELDITDAFYEPNGENMGYTVNSEVLTINNSTKIMSGIYSQSYSNQLFSYTIRAFDKYLNNYQIINLTIKENLPPVVSTQLSSVTTIADHELLHTFPLTYFSEPEGETIIYSSSTNQTDFDSWLSMSKNSTHLIYSGTPSNSQSRVYNVTLSLSDGHVEVSKTLTSFLINVTINHSPGLTGTPNSISNIIVGNHFLYIFDKSWITDTDGDSINYSCSINTTLAWISCTINPTIIIFEGIPNSNNFIQTYQLKVISNNSYTDVSSYIWTINFMVTENYPPTIGSMSNQTVLVPNGISWFYGSTLTSDPEKMDYSKSLQVDGSLTIPSWLNYDLSTFDFSIVSTSNDLKGVHNVTIILDDTFNPLVLKNFTISIQENFPPIRVGYIQSTGVVNYNLLTVKFEPINVLFNDPEGVTMTSRLILFDDSPLPQFLSYNSITNTLSGTPSILDVGDYLINFIAIDNIGQTSSTSFKVSVKPCYYKCTNCTEEDYNTCLNCKPGYYLQFNQCKEVCEGNYFADPLSQTCKTCHSYCSQCLDSTQFNCQLCATGRFYFENACYDICLDGYYGDISTGLCKLCNEGCTKCFGTTLNECTECNKSLLYIKSGDTQCSIATCMRGNYLNHSDVLCYPCDTGCVSCDYPNNHFCLQCNSIYLINSSQKCVYCNDVVGYKINDFGVCQEICGDGINLGKFECDDGNLENGDGCSNTCLIESGYTCKDTLCWEIVPPKGSITSVTTKNLVTIRFNEPVKFQNFSLMSVNLMANINGPRYPYTFDYKIVNFNDELKVNKSFTQMKVQISNIQATILGSGIEKVEFWFNDTSVVKDLANNSMSLGKIVGNLNYFEYIPPSTQAAASSGGQSMQYTLMTMFSVNMILKAVISSSAAVMWSLIHVLQLFRYILFINVNTSDIMETLISYLAIVVGDTGDTENILPDIIAQYLVNVSDTSTNFTLYRKFSDNGYDSPFLLEKYSRKILVIFTFLALGVPALFVLMKICQNIPFVGAKISNIWNSLYFNSPIRTLTEVYIEMSFCFFLNTLNISIKSRNDIVSLIFLFFFGLFILAWPFIVLYIMCLPPKYIKTKKFDEKYGTLAEDINVKGSLYRRSYYPLFVFGRLIVTATLVLIYAFPVVQMFIILGFQTCMIAFLIKIKPFKSQLQRVIAASDEFTIIFGVLVLYLIYISDGNHSRVNILTFVVIGIVVISLIKNMTIIIYKASTSSYSKLKRWIHKYFDVKTKRRQRIHKEREEAKQAKELEDIFQFKADKNNLQNLVEEIKSIDKPNSLKVTLNNKDLLPDAPNPITVRDIQNIAISKRHEKSEHPFENFKIEKSPRKRRTKGNVNFVPKESEDFRNIRLTTGDIPDTSRKGYSFADRVKELYQETDFQD